MVRLNVLFPMHSDGRGVSYTCITLVKAMHAPELPITHFIPTSDPEGRCDRTRHAVPIWSKAISYKLDGKRPFIRDLTEKKFIALCRPGDLAYLWSHVRLPVYRALKDKGVRIVLERINNHTRTCRRILDAEYQRLGMPSGHHIRPESPDEQDQEIGLADYIFSPSPNVYRSLLENGALESKLLPTSYGWDPSRILTSQRKPHDGVDVVFIGSGIVRKGLHLLLQAWADAGIKGRLILCGDIHGEIAKPFAHLLARPDVVQMGYLNGIGDVLCQSDIFAFASLEEGGPQVTYEAMGCGVPVLTTPMGAGAIARDGQDGFIINPLDHDGWVQRLRQLAADPDLRARLGQTARARAAEFVWSKVGARRREALIRVTAPAF